MTVWKTVTDPYSGRAYAVRINGPFRSHGRDYYRWCVPLWPGDNSGKAASLEDCMAAAKALVSK